MLNEREKAVLEALEEMDDHALRYAWNEYARENDPDDEILTWDDIDELLADRAPSWIVNRVYYGDYQPGAELVKFDGYGNIQSVFWYELKDYIDLEEMAVWYADAPRWAYIPSEIEEALAELDEDEEDEQTA